MAARKLGGDERSRLALSFRAAIRQSSMFFRFLLDRLRWERGTVRSLQLSCTLTAKIVREITKFQSPYFHVMSLNTTNYTLTLLDKTKIL